MLRLSRIKCKALKKFAKNGDESGIRPEWLQKVRRILAALDSSVHPAELKIPGFGFHELKGDRKGTYAVWVSGNWRITFGWDEEGPYYVDMEDYHGK